MAFKAPQGFQWRPPIVSTTIPSEVLNAMRIKDGFKGDYFLENCYMTLKGNDRIVHCHPLWIGRIREACRIIPQKDIKLKELSPDEVRKIQLAKAET